MNQAVPDRPRLLLLAHSCNPEIGSEPGLGWNRALLAAKDFHTWVLCDEDYNRAAIQRYIARHGEIANLQWVFVPPSRREKLLRRAPGTFYLSYNLWHRRALKIARQLHDSWQFDLVHQLNLCGYREPGYLWKLPAPFLWGPVGGTQNYPWRFLTSAGLRGAASEAFRNVLNAWQLRTSHRVGSAAHKASIVLAANSANAKDLAQRCKSQPRVMLETGVYPHADAAAHDFNHGGPLRILWSGVFEHRKALELLLHALAAMPARAAYELHILGRGPLQRRWRKIARRIGVHQHCRWLGWLDHPQALEEHLWADAFVFTSLRDTSGNVVLESLACGTPVLCLNHQGVAEIVTDDCGVKLAVTNPPDVILGLRDTLLRWHDQREELARLSCGAIQRAEHYSWERQGRRMADVYREILRLPKPEAATLVNGSATYRGQKLEECMAGAVAASSQGGL